MDLPDDSGRKQDWFDKLPKKLRIALLMVVTSATSVAFFLFGLHVSPGGEHMRYGNYTETPAADFLCSFACLVVTGLLGAAYLGYFDRNENEPPK